MISSSSSSSARSALAGWFAGAAVVVSRLTTTMSCARAVNRARNTRRTRKAAAHSHMYGILLLQCAYVQCMYTRCADDCPPECECAMCCRVCVRSMTIARSTLAGDCVYCCRRIDRPFAEKARAHHHRGSRLASTLCNRRGCSCVKLFLRYTEPVYLVEFTNDANLEWLVVCALPVFFFCWVRCCVAD